MIFGRFFKNRGTAATPPSAPQPTPQPQPAKAPPPPIDTEAVARRQAAKALLHREEVLDVNNRLYGYRYSHSASEIGEPSSTLLNLLREADLAGFAQRRLAVVPITADAVLRDEHLPLLAPHAVFVLNLAMEPRSFLTDATGLEVFRRIRDGGSRVGLTGVDLDPVKLSFAAQADVVFLCLRDMPLPTFEQLARTLKASQPRLSLAAEAVHSWPERRMVANWGFDYCLGDFLTSPDSEEREARLDQSRLVIIEMLNRLREDSDPGELSTIAKKDPGIAIKLLTLANSPGAGLTTPVASLEQAILVLGRDRLYRWLTVSMFRVGQTRSWDEALLEVALARARFLETVAAEHLSKSACDELFLVGLLSLFEVLLGLPLSQILERLRLPAAVSEVLLGSSGPYARYLLLALAVEKGQAERADELASQLGIDVAGLNATSQAALLWAEEALDYNATA